MMYEMKSRKPEPMFLPAQGIFTLPHHIGTGLWWHSKIYTEGKWTAAQLNAITVTVIRTPVPRVDDPGLTGLSPQPKTQGLGR